MFAKVQIAPIVPKPFDSPEAAGRLVQTIGGHPGFRSIHLMMQIGARQGLNLTLWDTATDAEGASARTRSTLGPAPFPLAFDQVYEVIATVDGPCPLEDGTVCQVSWFDGPRSAAENEAMRRAGELRIGPAIADVDGHCCTYVLTRPEDSAVVVIAFASSTETLSRMADAVYSTTLLPGEDPALLAGPSRVEIYGVDHQSFAAAPVA